MLGLDICALDNSLASLGVDSDDLAYFALVLAGNHLYQISRLDVHLNADRLAVGSECIMLPLLAGTLKEEMRLY